MQMAKRRFEKALSDRRFAVVYTSEGPAIGTLYGYPIDVGKYDRSLTRQILWHKQWLDYGRALGERHGFYNDPHSTGGFNGKKVPAKTYANQLVQRAFQSWRHAR